MTIDEAVSKAKRNSLIIEEFLTDTQIQGYVVDAANGETDYTAAMVDDATIAMLTAIAAVAPKTYTRGAITITRESVLQTLNEFKNKVGVGVVNLYRGDPDGDDTGVL
jgi:hypothetical protein